MVVFSLLLASIAVVICERMGMDSQMVPQCCASLFITFPTLPIQVVPRALNGLVWMSYLVLSTLSPFNSSIKITFEPMQ